MTGTSVLGIKYEGGVMLAADNLGEFSQLYEPRLRSLDAPGDHTSAFHLWY